MQNALLLGLRLFVSRRRADHIASEFRTHRTVSRVFVEVWTDIAHRLDTRFIFHPNVLGILLCVLAIRPGFVGQPGDSAPPPWLPDAQFLAGYILLFTGVLALVKFLNRKAWLSALFLALVAVEVVVVFLAYRVYFILFRVEVLSAFLLLPVLVAFMACKCRRYLWGEPPMRRTMPKVTVPVDPLKPMERMVIQTV